MALGMGTALDAKEPALRLAFAGCEGVGLLPDGSSSMFIIRPAQSPHVSVSLVAATLCNGGVQDPAKHASCHCLQTENSSFTQTLIIYNIRVLKS